MVERSGTLRHTALDTAENIKKWTKEALESIGLTTDELLQVEKPVESD